MNQRQSFNLFTTHLLNERASGGSVDAHFELIAVCQSYLTLQAKWTLSDGKELATCLLLSCTVRLKCETKEIYSFTSLSGPTI